MALPYRTTGSLCPAFAAYDYVLFHIPFLEPWRLRLLDYSVYGEDAFSESRFDYRFVFFCLIVLIFPFLWKRQGEVTKLLFFIYLGVVVFAFLFWFNVLYRDRIFIFAQLIEPVLLMQIFLSVFGRRIGAIWIFGLGTLGSLGTIYIWGPHTVLVF